MHINASLHFNKQQLQSCKDGANAINSK